MRATKQRDGEHIVLFILVFNLGSIPVQYMIEQYMKVELKFSSIPNKIPFMYVYTMNVYLLILYNHSERYPK